MRRFSLILLAVLITAMLLCGAAFGADREAPMSKEDYINSLNNSSGVRTLMMSATALPGINNGHVAVNVSSNGRYNMGLYQADTGQWYNIIYSWPSSPGTSFVTVRVDGQDYAYGDSSGAFVQPPQNNGLSNQSVWRVGDIAVRQVLQIGHNPATGAPDAAELRYTMTNAGTAPHNVGLRIMIDTMLQGNDSAPFRVPGQAGMEAVTTERDYVGSAVPDFWQAFRDLSDPGVASQYTMRGGGSTAPDRMAITNWGGIRGTMWNYTVTPGRSTGDSAVGMWWNPVTLAPGETRTIVTYYGKPRVGGTATLTLSCPSQLSHDDWSQGPFNAVAYLNNNTGEVFSDVYMEMDTQMNLVDSDQTHNIGNIAPGSSAQTTWRLQPPAPGTYTVRVNAYKYVGGSPELIATAESEVNALPSPLPDNVELSGTHGTASDGTPVAGRTGPMTVSATFGDPQPVSVTMEASDADGDTYSAGMTFGSGSWTHTFTPWNVGLWESPLHISIIPHYAGGDGAPAEFNVILVDPSGYVYNSARGEDWRLPGATVNLQYYDASLGSWVNMSESAYPGRMSPATNPQVTNSEGRYAWDVAEGSYRVLVSRPGFASATSREVSVPPEVTDLHVGLNPTDTNPPDITLSGVSDGQTYTGSVTADINAADTDSGVRYIAYSLDGAAEVTQDGSSATLTVSASGPHTISCRAVDQAGNESSGQVSFTIGSSWTPGLTWVSPLSGSAPADIAAGTVLPISFIWSDGSGPVFDRSVSIRVRNSATNSLITAFVYGAGITYDEVTGTYTQNFDTAQYNIAPGTQLKVMVYLGGKLKGTALVNVN
ncbi:MAG: carboxypeptidase-like regulatory domain-containing protein [Bacillota bacterium]